MGEIIVENGVEYIRRTYYVDHGKAGTTTVVVYDPCITEEAQQRRREAIVRKCEELIRRGLM